MAEKVYLSPESLFARIEALKKWQIEQQQKMLEQQTEQSNFLSHEHKRMYQALGLQDNRDNSNVDNSLKNSPEKCQNNVDLDDIPIISPKKDFDALLQEQLRNIEVPVTNNNNKQKCVFLKKGSGLSRFHMTEKDLAHKKPKLKVILPPKKIFSLGKPVKASTNISKNRVSSPKFKKHLNLKKVTVSTTQNNIVETPNSLGDKQSIQPKSLFENNQPSDYEALLAELMEVRQKDPSIFDTPVINNSSHEYQQLFEKELIDELKIFEVLEQKVSNSSFCSTSSFMTKVLEHPIKSTPQKVPSIAEIQSNIESPEKNKRTVTFAEQERVETPVQSDISHESDLESLSDSYSSVNSDDISDMQTALNTLSSDYKTTHKTVKIYKDMSTNTDDPVNINSDLLKTRLTDLENEIDTFRSENARVTKQKDQYETNSRNLDKRKKQLEKDFEQQKQLLQSQLDEEKSKLAKDRLVYERYTREIKDGKSLRQKDKEELSTLHNKVAELEQELKLKESKWGATHARIRNQLRQIEKENATLRTENTELRSKNGKLEATNKQLLSRRPSDTKVLHEINKNLSKLTQAEKQTLTSRRSLGNVEKDKRKIPNRTRSASEVNQNSSELDNLLDYNKENNRNSSNSTIHDSSKIDERSFYQIEQEYEKLFGNHNEVSNDKVMPVAETSSSNLSGRKDEIVLEDGSMQVSYSNGNVKTVNADGKLVVMQYHNGDMKETFKDTGIVKYLYADANTWHTTYPDGVEVLKFSK